MCFKSPLEVLKVIWYSTVNYSTVFTLGNTLILPNKIDRKSSISIIQYCIYPIQCVIKGVINEDILYNISILSVMKCKKI
jgi:hypothetical protein